MRQLQPQDNQLRYRLEPVEGAHLRQLLAHYPFTVPEPTQASKTDECPGACEREQLLAESLAEHREELHRMAQTLGDAQHLVEMKSCWRLTLTAAEREVLLQIMNDIRVGAWQTLGCPDPLPVLKPGIPPREYSLMALMHVAGAFEHHLLEPPGEGPDCSEKSPCQ